MTCHRPKKNQCFLWIIYIFVFIDIFSFIEIWHKTLNKFKTCNMLIWFIYTLQNESSGQEGGIRRNPSLPHTTKRRITANLKSINNQKYQKIKVHGTPTTKKLKKKSIRTTRPVKQKTVQTSKQRKTAKRWRTGWEGLAVARQLAAWVKLT